jgi:hypothetical protein
MRQETEGGTVADWRRRQQGKPSSEQEAGLREDAWASELTAAEISPKWMGPWTSHISAGRSYARWSGSLKNGKRCSDGKDHPVFAVFASQPGAIHITLWHVRVTMLVAVGPTD